MITVDRLMTRHLVTLETGRSALEAATLMKTRTIGSVFITQHSRIVGIVTESDIIRKVVGADQAPADLLVENIMSSPVIGIDSRQLVTDAADLMERHKIRHLAVSSAHAIVGVVSVRDLLHPVAIDEL